MTRLLIVRMSALGDIIHALPVLSAIRASLPSAEVDWVSDARYAGILDFVDGLTHRVITRPGTVRAIRFMRQRRYDAALDLQGLLKSAVIARASGAQQVVGFETAALRERAAAMFYTGAASVEPGAHVIRKNLSVLPAIGLPADDIRFPLRVPASAAADTVAEDARRRGSDAFALINAGAAWPNKRWPPVRFGAIAKYLRDRHGLPSYVLWGPGEDDLASAVVAASDDAAVRAPRTALGDLIALASRAALMVSGDTGPVHIAAAFGTPIVGLYGPTWPERNGPWDPNDETVSRAGTCECHHKRQCQRASGRTRCIDEISIADVMNAIDRRLARRSAQ